MASGQGLAPPRTIRFGAFELDVRTAELRKHGIKVRLHEQPFRILLMLLHRPGEVVLRDEIRQKLWPNNTVVEFDHGINAAIQRLRTALADSAETPRYVETIARRGYRFIATVEVTEQPNSVEAPAPAIPPDSNLDPGDLSGETLSHFRVIGELGRGGMGVVYRAEDLRLGRQVALKFLPLHTTDCPPGMRERFQQEARAAAALSHPNICTIHGVEELAGQPVIEMELLEGETLAAHLGRGPLPLEKALAAALQIAAALEEAHRKGIVHRDLKPANIMLTANGVKVLDFGLAKIVRQEAAGGEGGHSRPGANLGTWQYMSPEQAGGTNVDSRTDIWAFGVVLFEMLTGKPLFSSSGTVADIIAAVVTSEPDWNALPAETPAHVRNLLSCCLRKEPELRLRDIVAARVILGEPDIARLATLPASAAKPHRWLPWTIAAMALVGASVAGTVWLWPKPHEPVTASFPLLYPVGTKMVNAAMTTVVPSPDGRSIAFVATNPDTKGSLWIRPMGSVLARNLSQTDGATAPFWSPDSRFMAFFADSSLKKIAVTGGTPQVLCPVPKGPPIEGGTWNSDGTIVFAAATGRTLMRVPATGGQATPVTALDASAGERGHGWPQFLPDGRHLLYFALGADPEHGVVYVQQLGSTKRVRVLRNALHAVWSPTGHLLYPREGTLFAQTMDPSTFQLTGEPAAVGESVVSNEANGRAAFAVSGNGMLAYLSGGAGKMRQLAWYDREGKRLEAVGKPGEYEAMRLSPDDRSVALTVRPGLRSDLGFLDLATGGLTTATGGSAAVIASTLGAWSPDSSHMAANLGFAKGVLEWTAGSGKIRDFLPAGFYVNDWSPDGRLLLCADLEGRVLATFPADGSSPPRIISETPYRKVQFRFSPDGRSVAYTSYESGGPEVTVASFPSFTEKRQLSTEGGDTPAWRKDGRELFFLSPDQKMMAAEVKTGSKIDMGTPRTLFKQPPSVQLHRSYAPAGDGKRFLVMENMQGTPQEVLIVLNWTAALKKP
jgi:eukaryotic-like serine/threonine-protein kinase